jgi:hypothetical protein
MRSLRTRADVDSFLDDWVKALRSGDYQQAVGHLFDDDAYCCLGVACEVIGLPWESFANCHRSYQIPMDQLNLFTDHGDGWDELYTDVNLHEPIQEAIHTHYPGLIDGKVPGSPEVGLELYANDDLTHLNDSVELDFDQIADVISARREYLKGLAK